MIALQVNGKRVELEGPTLLTDYLEKLGADPRAIAVEHNGEIVERAAYATLLLGDGDRVEIVRMVGGGAQSGTGAQGAVEVSQQLPGPASS